MATGRVPPHVIGHGSPRHGKEVGQSFGGSSNRRAPEETTTSPSHCTAQLTGTPPFLRSPSCENGSPTDRRPVGPPCRPDRHPAPRSVRHRHHPHRQAHHPRPGRPVRYPSIPRSAHVLTLSLQLLPRWPHCDGLWCNRRSRTIHCQQTRYDGPARGISGQGLQRRQQRGRDAPW